MAYSSVKAKREAIHRRKYPSTLEVRFMRLMGAKLFFVGNQLMYTYSHWFWRNGCVREYRVGGFYIDFAFPRVKRGIEIDGPYHDVVADWQRDQILRRYGWSIMRIPVEKLVKEPEAMRRAAKRFIKEK